MGRGDPRSPVAITLRGRLGNHLFQFATVRALCDDGPVLVDDTLTSAQPLLEAVHPGAARVIDTREALILLRPPRLPRGRRRIAASIERAIRVAPSARWPGERRYEEAAEGQVDPVLQHVQGPVLLSGYFQNEGYFVHQADRIAAALRPPTREVGDVLEGFGRSGGSDPTVAVVVRAGLDYEEANWAQPYAWYRRQCERMVKTLGGARFAVFSDIPIAAEAVAESLCGLGAAQPLARLDPLTQLHLIARMDHAIVSASSFAWWGAWLGDQRCGFGPERQVVAPDPWIRPDLNSVPPARWQRVATSERAT